MACVRAVTMKEFRGMDLMSGSLRVYGRSRSRRGARPPKGAAIERKQLEPTATDDGNGERVGGDATSSVAAATTRKACAGAAEQKPKAGRATKKTKGEGDRQKSGGGNFLGGGPGKGQWTPRFTLEDGEIQAVQTLPKDGRRFVEAVNKEIYLVGVAKSLLVEKDVKVKQRVWEQLIDIAYGKNAKVTESVRPIINDLPGPLRD